MEILVALLGIIIICTMTDVPELAMKYACIAIHGWPPADMPEISEEPDCDCDHCKEQSDKKDQTIYESLDLL